MPALGFGSVKACLPKAGVLMCSGEGAVTLRGRKTPFISLRKDKSCNFVVSHSCSSGEQMFLGNGWSRGDIFKFANTTHLDVRHFSVAKENHQRKQPTFPLSLSKRDFIKLTWRLVEGLAHLPVSEMGGWGGDMWLGLGSPATGGGRKGGS